MPVLRKALDRAVGTKAGTAVATKAVAVATAAVDKAAVAISSQRIKAMAADKTSNRMQLQTTTYHSEPSEPTTRWLTKPKAPRSLAFIAGRSWQLNGLRQAAGVRCHSMPKP
jgi:hypothetical protein